MLLLLLVEAALSDDEGSKAGGLWRYSSDLARVCLRSWASVVSSCCSLAMSSCLYKCSIRCQSESESSRRVKVKRRENARRYLSSSRQLWSEETAEVKLPSGKHKPRKRLRRSKWLSETCTTLASMQQLSLARMTLAMPCAGCGGLLTASH